MSYRVTVFARSYTFFTLITFFEVTGYTVTSGIIVSIFYVILTSQTCMGISTGDTGIYTFMTANNIGILIICVISIVDNLVPTIFTSVSTSQRYSVPGM